MKNPYKLIEKANNTFNLYLDKYSEIEKYIESSKIEQNEIRELLNSVLELSQKLINENNINKKMINNLEYKVNEFDSNQKMIMNLINDLNNKLDNNDRFITTTFNDINNNLNINFNEIKKSIFENKSIIDTESNKQLNEIKTLNKTINKGFTNHDEKITTESNKQLNEIKTLNKSINKGFINHDEKITTESNKQLNEIKTLNESINKGFITHDEKITTESNKQLNEIKTLNESINDGFVGNRMLINIESNKQLNEIKQINDNQITFYNEYSKNQNDIQEKINSNNDLYNKLNDAVDLFVLNYEECKKSFFNDNEYLLKNYLDTDDLFRTCYFNNIQFLSYSPLENKILLRTKEGIILSTNNRFYTIKEVIGFDGYSVPQLYQFDDFVVFDIGMNRAYASLRFAEFDNCSGVYGFEIDKDTYNKAIYNINLNPNLSKKITPYNFGLSNSDEEVELYYIDGADGVNTTELELVDIQYEMKENPDKVKTKSVQVKKTSEIIENIIKNEKINSKIVLKIDTEGSEYNIIDDLIESGLIYKMDLILGEGHKINDRNLSKELSKIGFKEIERKDHKIVYSFAFVKEEFYDIWPLKT